MKVDMSGSLWCVRLICCGKDAGVERFLTWEEADNFGQSYVDARYHDRAAIISVGLRDGRTG